MIQWIESFCHPLTRTLARPALLDLSYPRFRAYILINRPPASRVTPHSVRKGAITQMVSKGGAASGSGKGFTALHDRGTDVLRLCLGPPDGKTDVGRVQSHSYTVRLPADTQLCRLPLKPVKAATIRMDEVVAVDGRPTQNHHRRGEIHSEWRTHVLGSSSEGRGAQTLR